MIGFCVAEIGAEGAGAAFAQQIALEHLGHIVGQWGRGHHTSHFDEFLRRRL